MNPVKHFVWTENVKLHCLLISILVTLNTWSNQLQILLTFFFLMSLIDSYNKNNLKATELLIVNLRYKYNHQNKPGSWTSTILLCVNTRQIDRCILGEFLGRCFVRRLLKQQHSVILPLSLLTKWYKKRLEIEDTGLIPKTAAINYFTYVSF